jgi:hypothetical protein
VSTKRQQAVEFFIQYGWSLEQSAGLVANFEAESGLRHDAVGDGGLAYGIAQWHPDRQDGFEALLGKPIRGSSLEDQLHWAHAELQSTEKRAGDALSRCTTAAAAADVICRLYERPKYPDKDAAIRAELAERIFNEFNHSVVSELPPHPPAGQEIPVQPEGETNMGAGLLMGLIQAVIGGFAPLARQKVEGALEKHGGDPTAATAIIDGVLSAIATATGTNTQTLRDDPKAAIAAVNTVQANPVMMQAVERDALAELDKLAPVLTQLHQYSKEEWAAEEDSKQAAFLRNKEDPSQNIQKPMMTFTMTLVGMITVFTGALLGLQMYLNDGVEPNGQIIILFVMLATTFVNMLRTQNDWGFGSSRSSAGKDETIKQMAKLK